MTGGDQSVDGTERSPEEIAEMVREFSSDVTDPDNWMISVPVDSFDAVKSLLDTDNGRFGTYYEGISFCYTQNHDQTRIQYTTDLKDWDERSLETASDRPEASQ